MSSAAARELLFRFAFTGLMWYVRGTWNNLYLELVHRVKAGYSASPGASLVSRPVPGAACISLYRHPRSCYHGMQMCMCHGQSQP